MKIILHGGPADGLEYCVPDQATHDRIVEFLEPFGLKPTESMEPIKTQTYIYRRTDQTDEEGRTVFVL